MRILGSRSVGGLTVALGVFAALPGLGPGAGRSDLHQGRRADLPGQVRGLPPSRVDRADVAAHVSGGAAVGAVDPRAGRSPADAAVAHRQDGRRAGVQERPLAQRRTGRDRSGLGRSGRPPGRSQGHAAREGVAHRADLDRGQAVRAVGARPRRPLRAVDAEGRRQRHLVEADRRQRADRAALGARRGSAADHDQGTQDHPSRQLRLAAVRPRRAVRRDDPRALQ